MEVNNVDIDPNFPSRVFPKSYSIVIIDFDKVFHDEFTTALQNLAEKNQIHEVSYHNISPEMINSLFSFKCKPIEVASFLKEQLTSEYLPNVFFSRYEILEKGVLALEKNFLCFLDRFYEIAVLGFASKVDITYFSNLALSSDYVESSITLNTYSHLWQELIKTFRSHYSDLYY